MTKILTKLTLRNLGAACESNMREWFLRKIEASNGEIRIDNGCAYGYSPIPANLIGTHRIVAIPHLKVGPRILFYRFSIRLRYWY